MDALGDGARDGDGGRGVALEGEERLADGDLDLLRVPRDDLVVAADDAEGGLRGGFAGGGDLTRAIEEEALRDEVRVVVDERFLEQLVEGVERETDGRLLARELAEIGGDLAADQADPGAVGVGEDILLALGEVNVRQGLAKRVGDLRERETLLPVRAQQNNVRDLDRFRREQIAPGVMRLLFNGSVDGAFEGEIGGDGGRAHGRAEEWSRRRGVEERRNRSPETGNRREKDGKAKRPNASGPGSDR